MPESLPDLLKRRRFREDLESLVQQIREIENTGSHPESDALRRWADSLARQQAERLFRSQLLNELARPQVITCDDLVESLWLAISGDASDSWYEFFCRHVNGEASCPRTSQPFVGIEGHFLVFDGMTNNYPMWRGATGMSVHCAGDAALDPDEDDHISTPRVVYFRVQGCCSVRALHDFREEVASALASVLKSIEVLKALEANDEWFPRTPVALNFPMREDDCLDTWPVGQLLDATFADPGRKSSIDRRVRNAMHLLIESDQQRHDAIALSLAVAAIEALLCRGTTDLTVQIAENTATLLEPDSHLRALAERFVRGLYKARSRTLHGDVLEHEAEDRHHARQLAAAVLHAILERRAYQGRMGEAESHDEFLCELGGSKWVGGEIPGVSPSPVRRLWRPVPAIPGTPSQ